MHIKFIGISAAAVLMAASLTSCGSTVSVYEEGTEGNTASLSGQSPDISDNTGASPVLTDTAGTESPTEQFSLDLYIDRGTDIPAASVIEGFQTVMQEPELPTGCEVVSLAQTLNYLGFDIDKVVLADNFMPIDYEGIVTMNQAYIGDPKATNGFGCSSPVIVQTADKYFASVDSPCYAADISGTEFTDIYRHIAEGRPIIVWITIGLVESYPSYRWTAQNGEEMWFASYQHCVTVYGYDKQQGIVYVADPLEGNVTYSIERFNMIYDIMGKQAVVICGDSETKGHHVTTDAEKSVVMTAANEKHKAQENVQ